MRRLSWVLAGMLVVVGGCTEPTDSGSEPDVGREGNEDNNATQEPDKPAPPMRELMNESLQFPRPPGGEDANEEFVVLEEARVLVATIRTYVECPVTYFEEAYVIVTAPSGNSTQISATKPLGSAQGTYTCQGADESFIYSETVNMTAEAGDWTASTSGECTCRAQVTAVTDPAASA